MEELAPHKSCGNCKWAAQDGVCKIDGCPTEPQYSCGMWARRYVLMRKEQ